MTQMQSRPNPWMGGAGRSGDGLRMVNRVSFWDLCILGLEGLGGLGLGCEWLACRDSVGGAGLCRIYL